MSGVELGLSIVGAVAAVDVAIKACKKVAKTCSAFRDAENEIYERSTRLESNCLQMSTQLEIFLQIRDQLDSRGQIVQANVLDILVLKLENADTKLKAVSQSWAPYTNPGIPQKESLSKRERTNYVMQKDSLDKAIDEIELWQRVAFNPLWFAIMKFQTQSFDKELDLSKEKNRSQGNKLIIEAIAVRNPLEKVNSTHVFLPLDKVKSAQTIEIAFSSAKSIQVGNKWHILDPVSDLPKEMARELAVRLKGANPSTFSLLTCLGAVHDEKKNEVSLVFRIPDGMSRPKTLRARIMASETNHSLSDRFQLATHLARAVFSVHTFDMVHKSIRPENIILFCDEESALGSAYLLGFERIRRQADSTRLRGDADWEKNLYRHPERQGLSVQDQFIMQHDIYSLGVCLLEIGLWSSFVEYGNPNQGPTRSQAYDLRVESSHNIDRPELIKSHLLSLATNELPQKMGTKYAKIVESCLTCLDLGNEDFGDESEFQDGGATVAVRYIEKILIRLSDISV